MKFKFVLGLDVGTNSLGWSLIKEFEDGSVEIIKTGVHIFPIGTIVDDVSNKEKTRNEQRRGYRGASRMRYRFKLRREKLKLILEKLNMLPDYSFFHKAKGSGQSYELYKLRADAVNPNKKIPLKEIGRIFMLLNKYRGFKSNAIKLQQDDAEAGEVKAGYESLQNLIDKSGATTIGEYFFKMHELGQKWYEENKWHNPNEPIDERAFNENNEFVLFNSNGIRRHHGRYTLRDMYLSEFDKIWDNQKKYYLNIFTGSKREYDEICLLPYQKRIEELKKFKNTNFWHIRNYCIYYQRSLKSQKKFVNNCQFERGKFTANKIKYSEGNIEKTKESKTWFKKAKKVCPKSHPYFQEFRIWQKLHQIRYSSVAEDIYRLPLKIEWIQVLAQELNENFELFLNKTGKVKNDNKIWFGKILREKGLIPNDEDYSFFIDKSDENLENDEKNENRISGNITYASFLKILGRTKFENIKNQTIIRKEQSNKNDYIEINESKLLTLWHHLYIAKDDLFQQDEWLRCILTEKTKWDLSLEQANGLIETGLQPDYCSYSSKVLKAILPEMRKGLNEYEALKATKKGYINEDNTVGQHVQLKTKVTQLKYQELRNPVVERSLSKTIKIVNAIVEKYQNEIDFVKFEIRIESTRQLRKPRKERENERFNNSVKDKLREQYAEYLTLNKERLGFNKDIYKNDPIIRKYELWLEMNMNETDEFFKSEFKAFSRITKKDDRLKHQLWLECGRICPYTGKTISFSKCFSSDIEIEHIIPLSRSLDNSFKNKTLTFQNINAEKGQLTSLEYMQKLGGDSLKNFKQRIKSKNNSFADSKIKQFFAEKVDDGFLESQLSNTSYIAKYTRTKMQEICRNVQFTNGSATFELRNNDWGLSTLLDKIRYEEAFGIDIDNIYHNLYQIKKDFRSWHYRRYQTTDIRINWQNAKEEPDFVDYHSETGNDTLYFMTEIEQFDQFRNKDGKKDRTDHRHHAIDAFITACCSTKIIKELSEYNANKEIMHLEFRDKIRRCFSYDDLKNNIRTILVSHSEKQTLIKKRINKIKTSSGVKEQITFAPQGKLHEESFYAKHNDATVRRVELFDNKRKDKVLFDKINDLDYNVKGILKWNYIEDKSLYDITKRRILKLQSKAFSKDEMEKNPFYRVSNKNPETIISKKGKPLPIVKSVRKRFNIDKSLINLPVKDENKKILSTNRYAGNVSNAILILYESINKDKKSQPKKAVRHFEIISFFDFVSKKNPFSKLNYDDGKLFLDEKNEVGLKKDCHWLKIGDIVLLYIDEDDKQSLDWTNNELIKDRLYIVKGLSSSPVISKGKIYEYGYVNLLKTRISKPGSYNSEKDINKCIKLNSFMLSHKKLNAIKLKLNILGEIEKIGEDCFI